MLTSIIVCCFVCIADAEKEQSKAKYAKLLDEVRERNRQREHEATFTEIWYTFVDPYATDVDERGSGKSIYSQLIDHEIGF